MTLLNLLVAALLLGPIQFPGGQETPPRQTKKPAESPRIVIDINQASTEDFVKLPGIGPELARRIVTYREKHGPFRRVEDLLAIRGIGPKKWKAIRQFLRVEPGSGRK